MYQVRKKLFKSLQSDLLACFLGLTILIIGIFVVVTLFYTEEILMHNAEETNQQLVDQVGLNVENYIDNIDKLLELGVQQEILHMHLEDPQRMAFEEGTQMLLSSFLQSRSDLYSAAIIDSQGECLIVAPDSGVNPCPYFRKTMVSKNLAIRA